MYFLKLKMKILIYFLKLIQTNFFFKIVIIFARHYTHYTICTKQFSPNNFFVVYILRYRTGSTRPGGRRRIADC